MSKDSPLELIFTITRLSRSRIFALYAAYRKFGESALVDKRRGKPKELLTKKQREEIIEKVKTKSPKDLGYAAEYWTTGVLGDWIEREYDVLYKSKTSIHLIFRKASFSYHKPERIYHERNEKEVRAWQKATRPVLKRIWDEKDTVILAGDEMILTTRTTIQKVWLPKGEDIRIEVSNGTVKRRNVYGFLNIRTGREHAFKTEFQNMHVTKGILKRIRKSYPVERIVLFWDSAGWHKGSVVQEFIKTDGNIKIIHFPRYAPEENPQEHVWKQGRSSVTHNRFIEDIDTATDEFVTYLNRTSFPYSLLGFSPVS